MKPQIGISLRLGLLATGVALGACNGDFTITFRLPKRADDTSTQKFDLPAGARLNVSNDVGNTRVSVDPAATQATVVVTRIALADTQGAADELLTKIVVSVTPPTDADNTLRIVAPKPAEATGTDSDFMLTVTENEDSISVITLSSSTLVAQVELRITLPPGHGADVVQDVGGIRAITLDTDSTLTTRRGSIRSISGKAKITAVTKAGGVAIDTHTGSLDVTTSAGGVNMRILDLAATDSVITRVTTGGVDITLPKRVNADLMALAETGSISFSRFDFAKTSGVSKTSHTLTATLNDGGAVIDLRTETGSIDIESK